MFPDKTLLQTNLLWSKGIASFCYFNGDVSYIMSDTESLINIASLIKNYGEASGLVWIRLGSRAREKKICDVDLFAEHILPKINNKFILITTDGDASVPADLNEVTVNRIVNNQYFRGWFTQNFSGSFPEKIFPLPIGLDLHTRNNFYSIDESINRIRYFRLARDKFFKKKYLAFSDFQLNFTHENRRQIYNAIKNFSNIYFLKRKIDQYSLWRNYASSDFVLSPRGDGIDCHMTYEALYLGAIVITKDLILSDDYNDLPIVLIEDWKDLSRREFFLHWKNYYENNRMDRVWSILNSKNIIEKIRKNLFD